MCAHKDKHRTPSEEMVEVDDGLKLRGGGTLVIVPVIALAQWRTELLKWTEPGTFSIYTYHGQQREKDLQAKACHTYICIHMYHTYIQYVHI